MLEIMDTNVLLRFLVGDNFKRQKKAEQWFKDAEKGKRKFLIKPIVVAEACFVLESFYKKQRKEIAQAMEVFLSQRWLRVENRKELLGLWPHYVNGKLLSFDKKLKKTWKEIA